MVMVVVVVAVVVVMMVLPNQQQYRWYRYCLPVVVRKHPMIVIRHQPASYPPI